MAIQAGNLTVIDNNYRITNLNNVDSTSAAAIIDQQVAGASATALHRSPNTITSMSVYDTSKDSDGGAWTEKCQHTSWYNETVYGKWLGSEINDLYARYVGSNVGAELCGDPDLNNPSYWVVGTYNPVLFTITGGQAIRQNNANGASIPAPINLTSGKTYRVRVTLTKSRPTITLATTSNYGLVSVQATIAGQANNVVSLTKVGNPGDILDFYITPTVNTNMLTVSSNTNSYTDIEAVSVKEVLSLNTKTNDYYQLSTNGAFYRVSVNMLTYSEQFDNSAWTKSRIWPFNAGSVSDAAVAPNGTLTMDRLVEDTSTNTFKYIQSSSVNMPQYTPFTVSIYVKPAGRNYVLFGFGILPNVYGLAKFDLTTGQYTGLKTSPNSLFISASCQDVGNGVYRLTTTWCHSNAISGAYLLLYFGDSTLTPDYPLTVGSYTGDGVSGIYAWGAQLEYGLSASAYEKTTSTASGVEVFRGNKREFPKLSAIVAESSNVTIYDLTEPGRPMWMRFNDGGTTGIIGWVNAAVRSQQCVSMYNGVLVTGSNDGGCIISFTKDDVRLIYSSAYYLFDRKISSRNQTTGFTTGGDGIVISGTSISAIAIAALTVAPIEQSTGLPISTIAIGSEYRVSLIKHDGTIVQSASTALVPYSLSLTNKYLLGHIGTNVNYQPFTMIAVNPALLANNFSFTVFDGSLNKSGVSKMAYSNKNHFATIGNNLTRSKSKNFSRYVFSYDSTSTIASAIDPAGNSGFFLNMTKRSYLGEINSSSLSYTVENGFKYSNTLASWTSNNVQITPAADPGPVGLSSASLVTPKVTNNSGISQGFTYPWGGTFAIKFYAKYAGKRYVALTTSYSGSYYGYAYVDLLSGVVTGATNLCTVSGPDTNGYYQIIYKRVMPTDFNQLGEFAVYVTDVNNGLTVSTSTTNGIYLSNFQLEFFSNPNTEFGPYVETTSSIIVREHITNYANGIAELLPFGTIMRTPVATGSQLVAYSGFSA